MKPYLIAVVGGSGSGKTTFSHNLCKALGSGVILSQDDYYKPLDTLSLSERSKVNFDSPDAVDMELLYSHLLALKEGNSIGRPIYDYSLHTRKAENETFAPSDITVVEGMLLLCEERIRDLFDTVIFIDVDEPTRLSRRIARDVAERGRSEVSVREQFEKTVKPMHKKHVAPCKKYADFVVTGGGENIQAILDIKEKINVNKI